MINREDVQREHVDEAIRLYSRSTIGRFIAAPPRSHAETAWLIAVRYLQKFAVQHPYWTEELKRSIEGMLVDWILDRLGVRGPRRLVYRVYVGIVVDQLLEWVIRRSRARELAGTQMFGQDVNDTLTRWAGEISDEIVWPETA